VPESDSPTMNERPRQGQWLTLPDRKNLLMVVHTQVYGQRLQDLMPLVESDFRLQTAFTVAPHAFNDGAARALHELGATVLPWNEAVRTTFDLAVAAGSQGMEQVRAPLIRMPHGAGHIKLSRLSDRRDPESSRSVDGLGRKYLTWQGSVVPKAVALAHEDEREQLGRSCPEALPVAEVVGDACHDRIMASMPFREEYRTALGVRPGQKLVVVCSTWGLGSSFHRVDALMPRLLELPRKQYKVAVLIHPNVSAGHGGHWQVRAWLAACRHRGIAVIPPDRDWRPLLVAADHVIGDHGSVTLYGTMTEAAILLANFPDRDVNPNSPAAALALVAPTLSPSHPLREQLAYATAEYPREEYRRIAARLSSEPGRFNRNMRRMIYRHLRIGQPAFPTVTLPLPHPAPLKRFRADRRRKGRAK
jgi:hypothetical protein